ncbi:MAG: hypothetical protein ACREP8_03310, partial [Candidatus Binatia bacterium]
MEGCLGTGDGCDRLNSVTPMEKLYPLVGVAFVIGSLLAGQPERAAADALIQTQRQNQSRWQLDRLQRAQRLSQLQHGQRQNRLEQQLRLLENQEADQARRHELNQVRRQLSRL